MIKKIRNIKGTKDILPNETFIWQELEQKIHTFLETYLIGYIVEIEIDDV